MCPWLGDLYRLRPDLLLSDAQCSPHQLASEFPLLRCLLSPFVMTKPESRKHSLWLLFPCFRLSQLRAPHQLSAHVPSLWCTPHSDPLLEAHRALKSDFQSEHLRLLIEYGADPHVRDKLGRSARDVALEMGELDLIALMESAVATPDSMRVYVFVGVCV